MKLLANDLSIHEQFPDRTAFQAAFKGLMDLRQVAWRFGRKVHCHRAFLDVKPIPNLTMHQAFRGLDNNELRLVMSWLTKGGPFWDDIREHGPDDYLECGGEVVTESAVGEAAFQTLHGGECGLVSITPSDWTRSPISVVWRQGDENGADRSTDVNNFWNADALEDSLRKAEPPVGNWKDLEKRLSGRFERLVFSENCFEPLAKVPFATSSADRILVLLDTLNRLAQAFDEKTGARTPEGDRIHREHFTGERARFSDSSQGEKSNFRKELTFLHPETGEPLFCPWHGKTVHQTLRLHFSWPVRFEEPVYIVYVGPKITRR